MSCGYTKAIFISFLGCLSWSIGCTYCPSQGGDVVGSCPPPPPPPTGSTVFCNASAIPCATSVTEFFDGGTLCEGGPAAEPTLATPFPGGTPVCFAGDTRDAAVGACNVLCSQLAGAGYPGAGGGAEAGCTTQINTNTVNDQSEAGPPNDAGIFPNSCFLGDGSAFTVLGPLSLGPPLDPGALVSAPPTSATGDDDDDTANDPDFTPGERLQFLSSVGTDSVLLGGSGSVTFNGATQAVRIESGVLVITAPHTHCVAPVATCPV